MKKKSLKKIDKRACSQGISSKSRIFMSFYLDLVLLGRRGQYDMRKALYKMSEYSTGSSSSYEFWNQSVEEFILTNSSFLETGISWRPTWTCVLTSAAEFAFMNTSAPSAQASLYGMMELIDTCLFQLDQTYVPQES